MTKAKELQTLVEDEVIPEIEESIDYLFELVDAKKATAEDKEELKETQELLKAFRQILTDLEKNEIDEEECSELIEEINEMRNYEEEDEL